MRDLSPEETVEAAAEAEFARDLLDTSEAGPTAIRGSLLRLTGYLAGVAASVLSVALLIRHLGVSEFGHYVTVLSLITIVQGITDAGLTSIGVREFSVRTGHERDRLMRNLLGVRLLLTVLGGAVATAFSAVAGYGSELVLGTALAAAGLVLAVAQGTFAIPLASGLRLGWVTATETARQLLQVAGIVGLVLAGAALLPFFAVPIPVGALLLGLTVVLIRGVMPLRPAFDRREWALLLRRVLPFAASAVIGVVYFRVTIIVMSLIASELQTGYYATAYRALEVLVAIPQLVVGSALPVIARAARDDQQRLRYVLQRLFDAMLIVGAGVGLAVLFGAPFAIEVLAGGRSDPSIALLQIQALALTANFVATAWQYGLLSLELYRELLTISAIALITSLTLTLSLVPSLEARGAAIAATTGEVGIALVALLLLARARRDLWPSFGVAARVVAAAAVTAPVLLIPGIGSVGRTVVGVAVYTAALVLLRAIPPELAEAFLGRRRTPSD
jgi:O-antigen/teichoic acid export membrane protein